MKTSECVTQHADDAHIT